MLAAQTNPRDFPKAQSLRTPQYVLELYYVLETVQCDYGVPLMGVSQLKCEKVLPIVMLYVPNREGAGELPATSAKANHTGVYADASGRTDLTSRPRV